MTPRRLNVSIATPLGPGGRGGIDRIMDEVRRQATVAPLDGVRLRFLTTRGPGSIVLAPFYLVGSVAALIAARLAGRVDVLHINLASRGSTRRKLVLARVARLLRLPYVIHLHGAQFHRFVAALDAPLLEPIRAMFGGASRVIVLGEVWRSFVSASMPVPGERIVVLPNASRSPPQAAAPKRSETPQILFLGEVGPRKGVPVLIDALERIRHRAGWMAVIAGNGEVEATRRLVAERGLADRIRLTGWLEPAATDELLAGAAILVLPSLDENLPMSVIEGMGYGLAVVSTPVGSVPDIIADGDTGLLVPVGDAGALAVALERLVADPSLRDALGSRAAAFHRAHLDIGPYLLRLAAVWRQAAARDDGEPAGAGHGK